MFTRRCSGYFSVIVIVCLSLNDNYYTSSETPVQHNVNQTPAHSSTQANETTTKALTTEAPATTKKETTTENITTSANVSCANEGNSTVCAGETNSSDSKPKGSSPTNILHNFGVTDENFKVYTRAFYVVLAVTGLVVVYLGVKTFIVRRKKKKTRHYDVLNRDQLQLNVMDDDEEEDELFDQSRRRLIS